MPKGQTPHSTPQIEFQIAGTAWLTEGQKSCIVSLWQNFPEICLWCAGESCLQGPSPWSWPCPAGARYQGGCGRLLRVQGNQDAEPRSVAASKQRLREVTKPSPGISKAGPAPRPIFPKYSATSLNKQKFKVKAGLSVGCPEIEGVCTGGGKDPNGP